MNTYADLLSTIDDDPWKKPSLDAERWLAIKAMLLSADADKVNQYDFLEFIKIATYPSQRREKF